MKFRVIGNTGINASVLGMGCMRLPVVNGDNNVIDYPEAKILVRKAIDSGINYIDTAYPYHGGTSEAFLAEALSGGYRERVTLITKSPSWLHQSPEDFDKYLDEQLEKLNTDHLDIYLLHAINKTNWENYKKIDVFKGIEKAKASGKIKNIGFSFHDNLDLFKEVVDAYPWDLCMIQFNYMDINEQAGLSGLKYAEEKGLPVIVMEPLKGGLLANPPEDIAQIMGDDYSPVEWALKYVANFENVKVVLSGMSNTEQLEENLRIADRLEANALSQEDLMKIEQIRAAFEAKVKVPCTQCQYCLPCPQGVQIPRVFTFLNRASIYNSIDSIRGQYKTFIPDAAKADKCVACGLCEPKCPQNIEIIKMLSEAHQVLAQNL